MYYFKMRMFNFCDKLKVDDHQIPVAITYAPFSTLVPPHKLYHKQRQLWRRTVNSETKFDIKPSPLVWKYQTGFLVGQIMNYKKRLEQYAWFKEAIWHA